jgi:hypothetical protein
MDLHLEVNLQTLFYMYHFLMDEVGKKNAKEKDKVNKLLVVFHILIPSRCLTASQPLTCCSDLVLCALLSTVSSLC